MIKDEKLFAARIRYATFWIPAYKIMYVETPKCACTTFKKILIELYGGELPTKYSLGATSRDELVHHRAINPVPNLLANFSADQLPQLMQSESVTRFCVVRNPYSRLVSAWADKIRCREPSYGWAWRGVMAHAKTRRGQKQKNLSADDDFATFSDFLAWILDTQDVEACDHHWRLMDELLQPTFFNYTHVLKIETLERDFDLLLKSVSALNGDPSKNGSGEKLDAKHYLHALSGRRSLPIDWRGLYDEKLARDVAEKYARDFAVFGYDRNSWRKTKHRADSTRSYAEFERVALQAIRERNEIIGILCKRVRELSK